MWIDPLVTIRASRRRLAEKRFQRVAALAWGGSMRARQGVGRERMIEGRAIKCANIRVASFMIRMAVIAFLNTRKAIFPMEARMCRAIQSNLLMAIKTELGLRDARERLMTFRAFALKLLMTLVQRARNYKAVEWIFRMRGDGECVYRTSE